MYKAIIRPFFFIFPPEFVHHFVVRSLKLFFKIPSIAFLIRKITTVSNPKLEKEVFGLKFKNPVGLAAGFDKQAEVYNELSNLGFGFIEIGTVTPEGQQGNPKPRLFRLPGDKALINRMGFNNKGALAVVGNLKKRKTNIIIGGNIGKNTKTPNEDAAADYVYCFKQLFDYVDYFVVNVSCPNVTNLRELQGQDNLEKILNSIQKINLIKPSPKPVLLKISPDLNNNQLDELIEIIKKTRINGVIATNTSINRNNLKTDKEKIRKIGDGGLSGKPLKKRSTEVIRYLAKKSGKAFAIIGAGGIFTADDAIEKIEAGADLIQIYTGFIYEGPFIAGKINKEILKSFENDDEKI